MATIVAIMGHGLKGKTLTWFSKRSNPELHVLISGKSGKVLVFPGENWSAACGASPKSNMSLSRKKMPAPGSYIPSSSESFVKGLWNSLHRKSIREHRNEKWADRLWILSFNISIPGYYSVPALLFGQIKSLISLLDHFFNCYSRFKLQGVGYADAEGNF